MHLIAHVFHRCTLPHDQGFGEVRLHAPALRVDAHQVQLLPGAVHDIGDAQVQFAGHDNGVVLMRELVEELHAYAIDFVVDVEARLEVLVWGEGRKGGESMGEGTILCIDGEGP